MSVPTKDEQRRRRLLKCKNFNGTIHNECDAGVNYDTVKDASSSPYRWPCMDDGAHLPCPLREYPTTEEVDAEDKHITKLLSDVTTTRKLITDQTKGKRNVQGAVDCPVCNTGKVRYSVAYNGHIHAQCSTEKCVQWIE